MNTAVFASADAVPGPAACSDTACFHCGEPLPALPRIVALDATSRSFCCDGCAAAAQWIRDARLDDF